MTVRSAAVFISLALALVALHRYRVRRAWERGVMEAAVEMLPVAAKWDREKRALRKRNTESVVPWRDPRPDWLDERIRGLGA